MHLKEGIGKKGENNFGNTANFESSSVVPSWIISVLVKYIINIYRMQITS